MSGGVPLGCEEARAAFAAFLDGELGPREADPLEAHLVACPSCREEAEGLAALDRDLHLLVARTEPGEDDRVREILAAVAGGGHPRGRLSSSRLRISAPWTVRLLRPALLAAGVLLAVGGVVALYVSGYRRRAEEAEARRLRLEEELAERERQRAEAELARRERERQRTLEELRRLEEERREARRRLEEIEERGRQLARAVEQMAREQERRELEESLRKARAQAEEERRRVEEEVRRREEEAARIREALAQMEREQQEVAEQLRDAQARVRDAAGPRKGAAAPPPTPLAVAPLDPVPWRLDPVKVDFAVGRGVEFLKGRLETVLAKEGSSLELVLWALMHAGVSESDPDFQQMLRAMIEGRLERTYNVALEAMILEELHRVKYQLRLQQCAQFLVDNQCANGQWSYGIPTLYAYDIHAGLGRDVATATSVRTPIREYVPEGSRLKPRVRNFVRVLKKRDGPAAGDNSNTQYALLGLRACHEAGILIPPEVIRRAQRWWRDSQHEDRRRAPSEGQGWGYGGKNQGAAYGSMTAGAVGSLAICDYLLGEDWRRDRSLQKGLLWLARHFSVTENPEKDPPTQWLYYYLYSLERAGVLAGVEKIGIHDWYARGVRALLESQQPDGSWSGGQPVHDTCFAILFLRRATRPLVEVETGGMKAR